MMTTFPEWFPALPVLLTEEQYDALPEEVCRSIDVVHGQVIRSESPTPRHNRVARRLAAALEAARDPEPCLTVETDIDVVLWRVPRFTFRRPDVSVYRCLDDETRKPVASDVLLVVEVTSRASMQADLVDKRAEYMAARIPMYLVLILDEKGEVEEAREFHLDAASGDYLLHRVHRERLVISTPVRLDAAFAELTLG
jgi:Uma2 family endonuclease